MEMQSCSVKMTLEAGCSCLVLKNETSCDQPTYIIKQMHSYSKKDCGSLALHTHFSISFSLKSSKHLKSLNKVNS